MQASLKTDSRQVHFLPPIHRPSTWPQKLDSVHSVLRYSGPGPRRSKVIVPGPQWKRSVFDGLAQAIVQSTREAGDIKLHVASLRLASTDIRIVSQ